MGHRRTSPNVIIASYVLHHRRLGYKLFHGLKIQTRNTHDVRRIVRVVRVVRVVVPVVVVEHLHHTGMPVPKDIIQVVVAR